LPREDDRGPRGEGKKRFDRPRLPPSSVVCDIWEKKRAWSRFPRV